MRKAVFLDRDGVINKQAPTHHYIGEWEEFEILPGVLEAIKKLNDAGYYVFVVTNQRGIARGIITKEQVDELHKKLQEELKQVHGRIDAFYVCPHDEGECTCRKPGIGLFQQAEKEFQFSKSKSWTVGDSDSDVEAGLKFGTRAMKTDSLKEAVEKIMKE